MNDGPPRIFDTDAIALHRARAERIGGDWFLLREAVDGLATRLGGITRTFPRRMELVLDDGERVVAPEPLDLMTSVLTLHTVNDLPGVLLQARRALKPDGLFLAALFGGDTLSELRLSLASAEIETTGGVSPRVAPFADVRDLGG